MNGERLIPCHTNIATIEALSWRTVIRSIHLDRIHAPPKFVNRATSFHQTTVTDTGEYRIVFVRECSSLCARL
jgi:hypothetical protein